MRESLVLIRSYWHSLFATDSGAYLVGSRFGKRKLMPAVSPNKTIEGSLGGILSAVAVTVIYMIVDRSVAVDMVFLR